MSNDNPSPQPDMSFIQGLIEELKHDLVQASTNIKASSQQYTNANQIMLHPKFDMQTETYKLLVNMNTQLAMVRQQLIILNITTLPGGLDVFRKVPVPNVPGEG